MKLLDYGLLSVAAITSLLLPGSISAEKATRSVEPGTFLYTLEARIEGKEIIELDIKGASREILVSSAELNSAEGCPEARRCGIATFPEKLPYQVGAWFGLFELQKTRRQQTSANDGGIIHHSTEGKTESSQTDTDVSERSSRQLLRELLVFKPADKIKCEGQTKTYEVQTTRYGYNNISQELIDSGVEERSHRALNRRSELGLAPDGEIGLRFSQTRTKDGTYSLRLYIVYEYDASRWGEALLTEHALRCESPNLIQFSTLSDYGIRKTETNRGWIKYLVASSNGKTTKTSFQ